MGLFAEKFKSKMEDKPKKVVSKVRTFEEIVSDTIADQRKIANGEKVYGTKNNKNGEKSLKKSWNKDGKVDIKIGIKSVLDQVIPVSDNNEFLELLDVIEAEWQSDPDLKAGFDKCKKAIEDQQKRRQEKMASNK